MQKDSQILIAVASVHKHKASASLLRKFFYPSLSFNLPPNSGDGKQQVLPQKSYLGEEMSSALLLSSVLRALKSSLLPKDGQMQVQVSRSQRAPCIFLLPTLRSEFSALSIRTLCSQVPDFISPKLSCRLSGFVFFCQELPSQALRLASIAPVYRPLLKKEGEHVRSPQPDHQ